MFKEGQKVVYPNHGAGVIDAITFPNGDSEDETVVISFPTSGLRISLPKSSVKTVGLRRISKKAEVDEALDVLSQPGVISLSSNHQVRQHESASKLKSGDLCSIAEVIRDLSTRGKTKSLGGSDTKTLDRALQLFVGELMLVYGVEQPAALAMLRSALDQDSTT